MSTSVPNDQAGGHVTYGTHEPPANGGTIALIAMIAGLIGAVLCLVAAGGVWAARSWANEKVDNATASVIAVIDRGSNAADAVTTKLNTLTASLDQVSAEAAAVANNPTPSEADEGTLRASLQNVGTRYDEIHANYEDLSVRIEGALDGLANIQVLFPSLDPVVQTLSGAFTTVDQKVTTLDSTITDIRGAVADVQALPATARSIAAGRLSDAVSNVSDAVLALGGRIDNLKTQVNHINDKALSYVTYATIGATVLFLLLFLVHVGLFHYARRYRRS